MKYIPENHNDNIHPEIISFLEEYRKIRNFQVESYVKNKTLAINEFFNKSGLQTAVIALSGGIDSAVTLALLNGALHSTSNGLKYIKAVTLPALDWDGVTDQLTTIKLSQELADAFNIELEVINMTPISTVMSNSIQNIGKQDSWSRGQMTPYLRISLLYSLCAILTNENKPGLICGTTNLDEGGYIGYIGKASDGAVDLQIINDLHKSEVYTVAKYLQIPNSIINAIPKPDNNTESKDEDIFGAPYEILELSRAIRNNILNINQLSKEALTEYNAYAANLDGLAQYNSHKYQGSIGTGYSASIHVIDCDVDNGWQPINILGND